MFFRRVFKELNPRGNYGKGENNDFVIDGSNIVVPRMRSEGVSPLPEVRAGGDGGAIQKGDRFPGAGGAADAAAVAALGVDRGGMGIGCGKAA